MNEVVAVTLDSIEVDCPHCSRFQYISLGEFGDITSTLAPLIAEDQECSGCGKVFDVTLEISE